MRLLNASATENVILALPGHRFTVVAMDGNPVPKSTSVEVLSLAVAERVDAIVEMNTPGVWILGSTLKNRARWVSASLSSTRAVGAPVWKDPRRRMGLPAIRQLQQLRPSQTSRSNLTFRDIGPQKGSQFDTWTINNKSWPDVEPLTVHAGKRYRLVFRKR